jgi:hypothetical protein
MDIGNLRFPKALMGASLILQNGAEHVVTKLFDAAGIHINGSWPWDPQVHNPQFYARIVAQGSLGLGEFYMEGDWDCEKLGYFLIVSSPRVSAKKCILRRAGLCFLFMRDCKIFRRSRVPAGPLSQSALETSRTVTGAPATAGPSRK